MPRAYFALVPMNEIPTNCGAGVVRRCIVALIALAAASAPPENALICSSACLLKPSYVSLLLGSSQVIRTPVDEKDYQVPFRFAGDLNKLTIKLGPMQLTSGDLVIQYARARAKNARLNIQVCL